METTVTERGQTAIPAQIRRRYRLTAHTKIMWLETREGLTIVPLSEDPMRTLKGRYSGYDLGASLLRDRKIERKHERREEKRKIR